MIKFVCTINGNSKFYRPIKNNKDIPIYLNPCTINLIPLHCIIYSIALTPLSLNCSTIYLDLITYTLFTHIKPNLLLPLSPINPNIALHLYNYSSPYPYPLSLPRLDLRLRRPSDLHDPRPSPGRNVLPFLHVRRRASLVDPSAPRTPLVLPGTPTLCVHLAGGLFSRSRRAGVSEALRRARSPADAVGQSRRVGLVRWRREIGR